jgi:hypothetical protein
MLYIVPQVGLFILWHPVGTAHCLIVLSYLLGGMLNNCSAKQTRMWRDFPTSSIFFDLYNCCLTSPMLSNIYVQLSFVCQTTAKRQMARTNFCLIENSVDKINVAGVLRIYTYSSLINSISCSETGNIVPKSCDNEEERYFYGKNKEVDKPKF